jgi:hypothetical protein
MKLMTAACAFVVLGGLGSDGEEAATWTQHRDGAEWTLSVRVREVAGPHGWAGELVRFTVRRDGRFLHDSGSFDGGRLAGMKTCFGGGGHLQVEELLPEAGPGWILSVAESTGNGSAIRACVVVPSRHGGDRYETTVVTAKAGLRQVPAAGGVELWGAYQEWGGGGTSTSVFVPFRLLVRPDAAVCVEPLRGSPGDVVPLVPDFGWRAVFIAGLRERNPDLMQGALDGRDPAEDEEPWQPFGLGLPGTRAGLLEMVDAVRLLARARDDLRRLAPDIEPDVQVILPR